jgi:hypothetical protein
MPAIELTSPSPLTFNLAADARLTAVDYLDDQIWQLRAGGGDPPALALETSYGLRTKSMRIFPGFRHQGATRTDPSDFTEPPEVELHLPNYLRLGCRPFPDLDVLIEYWIPDSKTAAGRITLQNTAASAGLYRLRLHAVLRPGPGGQPMGDAELGGSTVLLGSCDHLQPMVFMSGSAQAEQLAHPALFIERDLRHDEANSVVWVEAGLSDPRLGLERARAISKQPWDAEIARVELASAGIVEIDSGHPDWDLALARSQTVALGSLMTGTHALPNTSFVIARGPDQGYSARKSGRDYPDSWAGQDVFAALYLGWQLLPAAPEAVEDILRNFLHSQAANGEVDSRPGLAGQRSKLLAPPLLAGLAWDAYRQTGDRGLLREVYPPLMEFVEAWFDRRHDRDTDGAPEWDNPIQSGYPESPLFSPWLQSSAGLNPASVESPDLLAYLFHECQSLAAIAEALGRTEDLGEIEARSSGLRRALERSWSAAAHAFRPVDRDLHVGLDGEELGRGRGSFTVDVKRGYDPMVRLSLRIIGPENESRGAHITIHGRGPKGQFSTERIESADIGWFWETGCATSSNTFASINRVDVVGLSDQFETRVSLADHGREDIGSLLPLWSGALHGERAVDLIEGALTSRRFDLAGGIPACSSQDPSYDPVEHPQTSGVRMLWNSMLADGLLAAGHQSAAADLAARLLDNCSHTLLKDGVFRPWYSPEGSGGFGEPDSVEGLAPLRLFLRCLGVQLLNPWTIELSHSNPFDEAVTIRWKGLTVLRPADGPSTVIFPDGHEVEISGEAAQRVERVR